MALSHLRRACRDSSLVGRLRCSTATTFGASPALGGRSVTSIAVVGSGPAGFYFTDRILKLLGEEVRVDIFDRLPTPFGLVRTGVAPDHPNTKLVTNKFTTIASDPRVRFFGNVSIGPDAVAGELSIADLRSLYSATMLSYGASQGRKLGIPGEDLPGSFSATHFVNWYNGHPDFHSLPVDLSSTRSVVVVGVGNVALDCARILLRPVADLESTDIAAHALQQLRGSAVKEVHIVGRRGPLQNQFSGKELREILTLSNTSVRVHPEGYSPNDLDLQEPRKNQKAFAAMTAAHGRHADAEPHRTLHLHFLKSPERLDAASSPSDSAASTVRVGTMTLQHNTLERDDRGQQRAVAAPNIPHKTLPADLVIASVGYRAVPLAGVPFDAARGTVPHIMGRVVWEAGSTELVPGLYVSGWLKRGAQGIIGTNLVDSHETAIAVAEDFAPGMPLAVARCGVAGPPNVGALLKERGVEAVRWQDWLQLDAAEVASGLAENRPRVKRTSWDILRQACQAA